MQTKLDDSGIVFSVYNDRYYYNRTYSARYVGMTDTGFRRKIKKIEVEQGIIVPLINLPQSAQNKYIDRRVLDVFRKSVKVGREQEWFDELRKVINEINKED